MPASIATMGLYPSTKRSVQAVKQNKNSKKHWWSRSQSSSKSQGDKQTKAEGSASKGPKALDEGTFPKVLRCPRTNTCQVNTKNIGGEMNAFETVSSPSSIRSSMSTETDLSVTSTACVRATSAPHTAPGTIRGMSGLTKVLGTRALKEEQRKLQKVRDRRESMEIVDMMIAGGGFLGM